MTGLSISLSGMLTAARRQDIVAHNIANVATPGFRSLRADSVELHGGGAAIGSITPSGSAELNRSNVNLASEVANLIVNRNAYQANVSAFRAQADLVGELLDLQR